MTDAVADMVTRLIDAGANPAVAASVVAEAFALGTIRRQSAEHPVDAATEKRREYDRERQRKIRELRRQSADNPPTSENALTLTSLSKDSINEEGKKEKKVRARKSPSAPLSADWQPTQSHFEAAEKLKIPIEAVHSKAEDMRLWAKSSGALKADWDATFHGFLRRDAEKLSGKSNERNFENRAHRPAGPAQTHADAVLAGVANFAAKRYGHQPPGRPGNAEFSRRSDDPGGAAPERTAAEGDGGSYPRLAIAGRSNAAE
jgi:hypothetical protein